jgi:hypothetical protein
MVAADGSGAREAGPFEYLDFLEQYPSQVRRIDPDLVRELYGDANGELLALFAELHRH